MYKRISYLWLFGLLPLVLVAILKIGNFFEDCNDHPIVKKNISELIQSWPGFKAEEYYITTEDGYRLLMERSYSKITQKNPIIIVHGIAMNALGWVNRGNVSLARLLGDLGYDVWMLNYRGTWYSKEHINLKTSDKLYWEYNINNLGVHDVRSAINLVAEKTNEKAIYLGYSMGTTGFFIYSSTFPEEAHKHVKAMIALAPVTNFKNVKSIITYTSPVMPVLKWLIYNLWNGEILPGYSVFLRPLVRFSGGIYIIQSVANLLFGDDYEQIDMMTYPQFATQMIDTAAVEIHNHYIQIYKTGLFGKYDHGRDKNLKIYGAPTPPLYELSKISVPVAIFAGENDWLATLDNAKHIYYSQINPSVRCGFQVVPFKKWNHIDFLIARELPKYLYKQLFEKIKELDSGVCH